MVLFKSDYSFAGAANQKFRIRQETRLYPMKA